MPRCPNFDGAKIRMKQQRRARVCALSLPTFSARLDFRDVIFSGAHSPYKQRREARSGLWRAQEKARSRDFAKTPPRPYKTNASAVNEDPIRLGHIATRQSTRTG